MKQILKYTKFISGAFLTGSLLFTSCTDQFEKWNINPNEVTPEQMTYDNLNTGAPVREYSASWSARSFFG